MLAGFGDLARLAGASAFLLAAAWKLSHRRAFALAFRGLAPPRLKCLGQVAVYPVAAIEVAIGVLLVVGLGSPSLRLVGPVTGLIALGGFTVLLLRSSGLEECGCWAMPFVNDGGQARVLLLLRNTLLIAAFAFAALLPARTGATAAVAAPAALLMALFIVELPTFAAVATFRRRAR